MATINATVEKSGDGSVVYFTYTGMAKGDQGAPIPFAEFADRSVQAGGTWDSATFVWQGSNDGTTWFTLNDPGDVAISKTGNFLESVLEMTRYARPSIGGSGGSTDIDVVVACRRQSSLRA